MGLTDRPYIGTWKLNNKKLIQYTPDVLVYINGDLTLPGCSKCNSRIDLQRFITQVDVDAGVEPTSASATINLAFPVHHHESLARDAGMILRSGLEVHIYQRGYFPVKGLYANLEQEPGNTPVYPKPIIESPEKKETPVALAFQEAFDKMRLDDEQRANAQVIYEMGLEAGFTPAFIAGLIIQSFNESGIKNIKQVNGPGLGLFQLDPKGLGKPRSGFKDERAAGTADTESTYNAFDPRVNMERMIYGVNNLWVSKVARNPDKTPSESFKAIFSSPLALGKRDRPGRAYTKEAWEAKYDRGMQKRDIQDGPKYFGSGWKDPQFSQKVKAQIEALQAPEEDEKPESKANLRLESQHETLSGQDLGGRDIENLLAYPYYHVFHGVVTDVSKSYDAGVQTITLTCISILQLWQYLPISTNASLFGARPVGSKNKMNILGHNFTGMHPYAIIYTLYEDLAGAGAGVSWVYSHKTNVDAVVGRGSDSESLWSVFQRYWDARFQTSQARLRLHGATGELFNTFQAGMLGKYITSKDLTNSLKRKFKKADGKTSSFIHGKSIGMNLGNQKVLQSLVFSRGLDPGAKETGSKVADFDVDMAEMIAFVEDIGAYGDLQFFESQYDTKMNVAQEVTKVTGFEFYQDVDGDFVFKPPFYNLDTSSARVYRIEDIDIISISMSEKEPAATYIVGKGNWAQSGIVGHGVENEFGVQGTYIDYRLVAQYGWRAASFECKYLSDRNSVFFMSMNMMDLQNAHTHTASLTIPLRPEIRPGYPVYIVSFDCYYYVTSISHSFFMGGRCTTTLTLTAKRSKFYAPGKVTAQGVEAIDLSDTTLPEKPLEVLDNSGQSKLSGFPNVVMALDPEAINPLFYVLGADIDLINTPLKVQNLVQTAVNLKVLTDEGGGYYSFKVADGRKVLVYFDLNDLNPVSKGDKKKGPWKAASELAGGAVDLMEAANRWHEVQVQMAKEKTQAAQKIKDLQTRIRVLENQLERAKSQGKEREAGKYADVLAGVYYKYVKPEAGAVGEENVSGADK